MNELQNQEDRLNRIVVDPSALQYLDEIREAVGYDVEIFVPDELITELNKDDTKNLAGILKYWNGYALSQNKLEKISRKLKDERLVKGFSKSAFEYDEEENEIFNEILEGRKGPRDQSLKSIVSKLTSKIVAFARQFHATIFSLSAKLIDLLTDTSVSFFNLSRKIVEKAENLPEWYKKYKKNKKIRKKRKYLILARTLGITAISNFLPWDIIEKYLAVAGVHIFLFVWDP